ncbi:hypothetical protein [Mesorhizobium sp. 2RAF45]|uniref:hypothetical protein n=1 Tax=Mesorhizobium sp. 2RAF45 TaxID=3233001 RepID=UPI003F976C09
MIVTDRERFELGDRHAVAGIDIEQRRRHGGELEALLDDGDGDEESGGNLLLGHAFVEHVLERSICIQRMKWGAIDVLSQRNFLGHDSAAAQDTRNGCGLGKPLLVHKYFESAVAAAAGRDLEHARLLAAGIEHWTNMETLDQAPAGDRSCQILNRDAGLDAPDVGLGKHQLVERNVARGRQGDLLNGSSHGVFSATGAESLSLDPHPS